MNADSKRFTISITPSMEVDLNAVKEECYCDGTRNDMIRDLISRGLASLKSEDGQICEVPKADDAVT